MIRTYRTQKGTELPLQNLKGKEYLLVAHRLLWFREDHPYGRIDTECIERTKEYVIYRACVYINGEKGEQIKLGDGVKREDYSHFPDAEEKAATGAIGRALAVSGWGTQFCSVELEEGERIVDSPVQRPHATPASTPSKPIAAGNGATDLGEYKVSISKKFRNVKFKDIRPFRELLGWIDWAKADSVKKKQPFSEELIELAEKAEQYAKQIEGPPPPPEGPKPPADWGDEQFDSAYDYAGGAR